MLRQAYTELEVAVRLPAEERVDWGREILARVDSGGEVDRWVELFAFGVVGLQDEFGAAPVDRLHLHALRLGDLAIATQPCELFCQFGLDIKRRSPSAHTSVCGIVNGYNGYWPTIYGIIGGGYSGSSIHWTRLKGEGGYRIVDTACRMISDLWRS